MSQIATPRAGEFTSVSGAAAITGYHRTTVWKWINAGHLEAFTTPGGRTVVRVRDLVKTRKRAR